MDEIYRPYQPTEAFLKWKNNSCYIDVIFQTLFSYPPFLCKVVNSVLDNPVLNKLREMAILYKEGETFNVDEFKNLIFKLKDTFFKSTFEHGYVDCFSHFATFYNELRDYLQSIGFDMEVDNFLRSSPLKNISYYGLNDVISIRHEDTYCVAEDMGFFDVYDNLKSIGILEDSGIFLNFFHKEGDYSFPEIITIETEKGTSSFVLFSTIDHEYNNHFTCRFNKHDGTGWYYNGMNSQRENCTIREFTNYQVPRNVIYMEVEHFKAIYENAEALLKKSELMQQNLFISPFKALSDYVANNCKNPNLELYRLSRFGEFNEDFFEEMLLKYHSREELHAVSNPDFTVLTPNVPLASEEELDEIENKAVEDEVVKNDSDVDLFMESSVSLEKLDNQECSHENLPKSVISLEELKEEAQENPEEAQEDFILACSKFFHLSLKNYFLNNSYDSRELEAVKIIFKFLTEENEYQESYKGLIEILNDAKQNPNFSQNEENFIKFKEIVKKIDPYVNEFFLIRAWHILCDFVCDLLNLKRKKELATDIIDSFSYDNFKGKFREKTFLDICSKQKGLG
ncbi:MAG: hypothetical protein LBJ09_01685 [Clostridiales bacterium]|jgi:hypothetical protein|nr:hypothetical protein [Clostridiales bacterium]